MNRCQVEEWKDGMMERLSELESENLMSRLWEGQWERIMMEECLPCEILAQWNSERTFHRAAMQ